MSIKQKYTCQIRQNQQNLTEERQIDNRSARISSQDGLNSLQRPPIQTKQAFCTYMSNTNNTCYFTATTNTTHSIQWIAHNQSSIQNT